MTGRAGRGASDLGRSDADLPLVLAAAILVGGLADVVGLGFQENHLGHALVGVDRASRAMRRIQRSDLMLILRCDE